MKLLFFRKTNVHSIDEIKVNLANSVPRLRTIPTTEQKPSDSSAYSAFFDVIVYVILCLAWVS